MQRPSARAYGFEHDPECIDGWMIFDGLTAIVTATCLSAAPPLLDYCARFQA